MKESLIPLAEAAKLVNMTPQTLRLWRRKGKLLGYKKGNRIFFTPRELNDTFNLNIPVPEDWYIGTSFKELALNNDQRYSPTIKVYLNNPEVFDGNIYITDIELPDAETFRFVCSRIYAYNTVTQRFRPDKSLCHLVISVTTRPGDAKYFKNYFNKVYPEVILLSHKSHLYRVKSKYYEQLKTENKRNHQGNTCKKRKPET